MMKPLLTLFVMLVCLPTVSGCGGRSEPTVADQSELDAYIADNPEAAAQMPPPIENDR